MKRSLQFEYVEIGDEYIAVPVGKKAESFSGVVALSESAVFLLNKMNTPKTVAELVDLVLSEYDVDVAAAEKDVKKLVDECLEMGIMEK